MANRFDVSEEVARRDAEIAARRLVAMGDIPKGETRPAPNDEHHRTFQLAMRHRELNEQYAHLLDEYAGCMKAFAEVLDIPREATAFKQ